MSQRLIIPHSEEKYFATGLLERALYGAAREFLARPSKGLRARLVQVSYEVAGGTEPVPSAALDVIELLHSGSLIVDDIQDGADLRRGAQALHHVIGTPLALNAGNWLYFVALTRLDELALDDMRARALARATHRCLADCHEGQALDLGLKVTDVNRSDLPSVARLVTLLKTGEPMGLAARIGATLAGSPASGIETLVGFGKNTGLALQMLDDLSSVVVPSRYHKGIEDLQNQRISWVWAWASEVVDPTTFHGLISQLSEPAKLPLLRARLAEIVEPLGRARVHSLLESIEGALRAQFSASQALDLVHADLMRLEISYG